MPSLSWIDLLLHVVDGIRWLHFEGDGLASESLDGDLHASSQTQHQVQGGLFLDVVVQESAAVLQLLSSEDKALLAWMNALFKKKRVIDNSVLSQLDFRDASALDRVGLYIGPIYSTYI